MLEKKGTNMLNKLLNSSEPSIRLKAYKLYAKNLEESYIRALENQIKESAIVKSLLSERDTNWEIPHHPYSKWDGSNWVLAILADLDYPEKDESLLPLKEQNLKWILSKEHGLKIKNIDGRVRRCASQEGNVLYSMLKLGLYDSRADEIAERLMSWQWADGGWNCDKNPAAVNSSFMETLIPMRALNIYSRLTGDKKACKSVEKASEVFLKRRLFKKMSDDSLIDQNFLKLHYPCYWHYDILFALKVLYEAGFIHDPRCNDALDYLEEKKLADGGFPAEAKYYYPETHKSSGRSLAFWGGVSSVKSNEFVTIDALLVLKHSGRKI